MTAPMRPLSFTDTGRHSPFRRQNSSLPATTVRATTPGLSPSKAPSGLSPTKPSSLSPEKASPFVRRPSQMSNAGERPISPFARPNSGLSIPLSPSRNVSNASSVGRRDATPEPSSPTRRMTPPGAREGDARGDTPSFDLPPTPTMKRAETPSFELPKTAWMQRDQSPSPPRRDLPSPFDGPSPDSPSTTPALPSQANLRPSAHRVPTSSTVSTIRAPPLLTSTPKQPQKSTPTPLASRPHYTRGLSNKLLNPQHPLPDPLLRSMREAFEVLDPTNTGTLTATSLAPTLEQLGLDASPASLAALFPSQCGGAAPLNLARYLETMTAELSQLSHEEELRAAFEAFDADDSGQIDVAELRGAVVQCMALGPGGREDKDMSEREVEGVLGEFASRRHFGGRGTKTAGARGEVFRYREFMAAIGGGAGAGEAGGLGSEGLVGA
ncbi:hypothetical protein LTR53_000154 [Teratosphaeriaceae sp. CCFEE 6253]|nr:hypothetical protein LTR53_000154 [Teratosphaeriaceae sp. CCFEE 6253]